jgi:WD40-like Beta Propeller Repeat
MAAPRTAPYGSWKSPITSDLIVAATVGLEQPRLDGADVYWVETRPAEGGRHVIVRRGPDGHTADRTPAPLNARTRAHEYGGGAYAVADGTLYFSNFADQRLYRQDGDSPPRPLTPEGDLRYADAVIDRRRGRIVCVREDHTAGGEPVNALVSLAADGGDAVRVLASGNDFYSSPRLSPDGGRLAWLTWNHPNMPWDGTELWVAEFNADGSLGKGERVADGADESIFQPEWSPDGVLHFVSDRTGWWNLYRWRDGELEALAPKEMEFARPAWMLGWTTYAFLAEARIVCTATRRGEWRLYELHPETGLREVPTPFTEISPWVRVHEGGVVVAAGSPTLAPALVHVDVESGAT